MGNLLRRLHDETFVLNVRAPLASVPHLRGFTLTRVDDTTFEAEVSKEQSLNELFAQLSPLGIEVVSMRNKVNRLEEVFMRLVENRGAT
jgi:ABC-2 type transport system ATP-binding protein